MFRAPSVLLIAVLACLPVAPAFGHSGAAPEAPPPPQVTAEKITERAYALFGKGGNVGVLITDAGVVVVDDQYEDIAPALMEQIRRLTDRPVRYLINTHYHGDHTGGNPVLGKGASIVAHHSVRTRLLEYPETIVKTFPARIRGLEGEIARYADAADPYRTALEKDLGLLKFFVQSATAFDPAKAAPPVLTYDGTLRIWLGEQEVRVYHFGPGHTDGDSVVYFPREKVLHMGDLFFNGMYPFIDALGGGSARGYVGGIDRALAAVPPDARVIPGHGPVTDVKALRRYRDFMADLVRKVEEAIAAGKTKVEAVRSIRMDAYPEIKPSFRTLGNDVATVFDELTARP